MRPSWSPVDLMGDSPARRRRLQGVRELRHPKDSCHRVLAVVTVYCAGSSWERMCEVGAGGRPAAASAPARRGRKRPTTPLRRQCAAVALPRPTQCFLARWRGAQQPVAASNATPRRGRNAT